MNKHLLSENEIATEVLGLCFKIHTGLGPGLLESVYEEVLCYELRKAGYNFTRQQAIPVIYEEIEMDIAFKSDVIVENKVLFELKSTQEVTFAFKKITLTYLRLTEIRLGYLINFNEARLKDGITRIVNNLQE